MYFSAFSRGFWADALPQTILMELLQTVEGQSGVLMKLHMLSQVLLDFCSFNEETQTHQTLKVSFLILALSQLSLLEDSLNTMCPVSRLLLIFL